MLFIPLLNSQCEKKKHCHGSLFVCVNFLSDVSYRFVPIALQFLVAFSSVRASVALSNGRDILLIISYIVRVNPASLISH